MKKIDIKIVAKKLKHAIKKIGSDADKDWKIVMVLFVLGLAFSVFFHINTFFSIQNIMLKEGVDDLLGLETLDTLAINRMVEKYEKRESQYKKIASSTSVLIDPAR